MPDVTLDPYGFAVFDGTPFADCPYRIDRYPRPVWDGAGVYLPNPIRGSLDGAGRAVVDVPVSQAGTWYVARFDPSRADLRVPFIVVTDDAHTLGYWASLYRLPDPVGPVKGNPGDAGTHGWSPVVAIVVDGHRRVEQVTDWIGGTGVRPPTGQFKGPLGFVATAAEATDVRGPSGTAMGGDGVIDGLSLTVGSGMLTATATRTVGNPVVSAAVALPETGATVAALTAEEGARAAEDTALSGRIDIEGTRRANADAALTASVAGEITARGQADTALGVRITADETALAAEATVRADADTALGIRIDNVPSGGGGSGLTAAAINSLSEGAAHTTAQVPGIDAQGALKKFSFSSIINLVKSSAGLARQLLPSADPSQSGRLAIVNATGNGWSFARYPSADTTVPVYSHLPSHPVDRRHRLAIVPTLYHVGTPEGFDLTVGFDPPICGYNRISGGTLGSVTFNNSEIEAPFSRLLGAATSSTDWGIDDSITFPNETTAEEFTEIDVAGTRYNLLPTFFESGWTRRIQNGPRFDSGNMVEINLFRADGSAFHNTVGVSTAVRPGLWEYIYDAGTGTDGTWYKHTAEGLVHVDVIGAPTGTPSEDEYLITNRDGDVYPVLRTTTHTDIDASGTSVAFTDPKYIRDPETLATLFNDAGAWGFFIPAVDTSAGTATQSGATLGAFTTGVSWIDTWQNIIDGSVNHTDTRLATLTALRDATYLGAHRNADDAADHMTRLGIDAAGFAAGTFYFTRFGSTSFGIRRMTAYTPGSSTDIVTRSYGGRLATYAEFVAALDALETAGDWELLWQAGDAVSQTRHSAEHELRPDLGKDVRGSR